MREVLSSLGLMLWFIGGGLVLFRLHRFMKETEQRYQNLESSLFQEISEIKRQFQNILYDIEKIPNRTRWSKLKMDSN